MSATVLTRFQQRLRDGQPLLGTWLTLGSPLAADSLAHQGFDWLGIELGKVPCDGSTKRDLIRAARSTSAAPFVRVPRDDARAIRWAREHGAGCVLLSGVESRADAEVLVRALTGDAAEPHDRVLVASSTGGASGNSAGCDHVLRTVMIETARGLHRAEEILSVRGIDACFILVSHPLSIAGGIPPGLTDRLRRVLAICHERRITPGIQAASSEQAATRISEGWHLIGVGSDTSLLAGAAAGTRQTTQSQARPRQWTDSGRSYEVGCAMLGPKTQGSDRTA